MSAGIERVVGSTQNFKHRMRAALIAAVVVAWVAATMTPASADEGEEEESHCVINVLDTLLSGEFVMSAPTCFATFEEAMAFIGGGDAVVASGPQLFAERPDLSGPTATRSTAREPADAGATGVRSGLGSYSTNGSSTFTIGIHFKGKSGSGSSISIVGSSCSGGYWNASSSWKDVISSSYNGCARLSHYSAANASGSRYDTRTVGQTDNISSWMDNRTESVKYLAS